MSDVVLFDEIPTACGRRFGVACLNAPTALNALSLPMVQALLPQLQAWARDPGVVGVLLQATGDKAFCAGGDLRELYQSMRDCGSAPNAYAQGFFAQEYQLDHLIHTYPKPFVCWGQGIVMGGGIGLMAGASHRVVTPNSKLAMPEISIGLYPDVGGSWVLRQMPGRVGLFLALTGVPLNAADALFCGLADFHLPGDRGLLLAVLEATRWSDAAQDNRQTLTQLLSDLALPLAVESPVQQHFGQINDLLAGDALLDMAVRLRGLDGGDVWLQAAATTFAKGSPTSVALAFAMWQQAQQLSLAEVFRLEYRVSVGCCAHPDFAEGIRALLVDKDRNPHWTPDTLDAVTPDWIDAHFFVLDSPHPLASLA